MGQGGLVFTQDSSESDLSPIELHFVFNSINMCRPLLFLDMRESSKYDACRIRGALNIDTLESPVNTLEKLLTRVYLPNSLGIILVVDQTVFQNDFIAKYTKLLHDMQESANKNDKCVTHQVHSVEYLDFDLFYNRYASCSTVFEGTTIKATRKGLVYYFPTEIVPPFLYLGDYQDGGSEVKLTDLGITALVDASGDKKSAEVASKLGIAYLPVEVWDQPDADLSANFDAVVAFIAEARGKPDGRVLVHCQAGISRSATLVMAYLMAARQVESLEQAVAQVLRQRWYVMPNVGFRAQLRDFEQKTLGKSSFADDATMLAFLNATTEQYKGVSSSECDHDRKPIVAGRVDVAALLEALPVAEAEAAETAQPVKPKKSFLKRGQGKRVAVPAPNIPPAAATVSDQAAASESTTSADGQQEASEAATGVPSPPRPWKQKAALPSSADACEPEILVVVSKAVLQTVTATEEAPMAAEPEEEAAPTSAAAEATTTTTEASPTDACPAEPVAASKL